MSFYLRRIILCLLFFCACRPSARGRQVDDYSERLTIVSFTLHHASSYQVLDAVRLAVNESNAGLPQRLRFEAETVSVPNKVRGGNALNEFMTALNSLSRNVAAVGLPLASLVEFVAAAGSRLEAPVITTSLSPRKAWSGVYYSSLLHAAPSNDEMVWAVKDLIQQYSWSTICTIYSDDFSSLPIFEDFVQRIAPIYDVTVAKQVRASFDSSGGLTSSAVMAMNETARSKCIVFLVGVNAQALLPIMRAAHENGLIAEGTAWIFLDFLSGPRLLTEELIRYLDGGLIIRPRSADVGGNRLIEFGQRLRLFNSSAFPCSNLTLECISLEAAYAYEATLQLCNALAKWSSLPNRLTPPNVSVNANITLRGLPNGRELIKLLRNASWDGVLGRSSFNASSHTHGFELLNIRDGQFVRVGNWSQETSISNLTTIQWTGRTTVVPEAKLRVNSSLNILVPLSAPFSYLLRTPPRKNEDFAGVAIDVIRVVAEIAGFNYTLHNWEKTWDEMIEQAGDEDNEYDMAIGSITVKGYRTRICNFTRSVYLTGLSLLTLRPEEKPSSYWAYLKPFHWTVWVVFLCTIFSSAIVMQILDPEGIATERTGHWYSDALFFTTNVFLFVHEADVIKPKLARAFLIVLQFLMHVILAAYTANMATFLSAQSDDIEVTAYSDLLHKDVGCRNATTNWVFAKNDLGLRHLLDVKDANGAIAALRERSVTAYLADIPHLDNIAAKHCDLVVVGRRVDTQEYAFAMRRNSAWLAKINRALSVAITEGVVTKGYDYHLNQSCRSLSSGDTNGDKALGLSNLGSLFVVAVITAGAMAVPKLLSMFNHRYLLRNGKQKTVTIANGGVPGLCESVDSGLSNSLNSITPNSMPAETNVLAASLKNARTRAVSRAYSLKDHVVYLN